MPFSIRQLRHAIAAADHGSFYRAARALDIEQSTLSRSILRTKMYNGNVEKPIWRMFRGDPDENILAWQTKTLHKWSERMPVAEVEFPHLTIVRLRHPRETERWLRAQAEESGVSIAPPKRRSRDR